MGWSQEKPKEGRLWPILLFLRLQLGTYHIISKSWSVFLLSVLYDKAQCGLSPEQRFTFYDHVHTTGETGGHMMLLVLQQFYFWRPFQFSKFKQLTVCVHRRYGCEAALVVHSGAYPEQGRWRDARERKGHKAVVRATSLTTALANYSRSMYDCTWCKNLHHINSYIVIIQLYI